MGIDRDDELSRLYGVCGTSANDVWVVGQRILHWDGEQIESHQTTEVYGTLQGVFAFAPDDVWAVGRHGMVARFDGENWRRVEIPHQHGLNAIWGSSPADVWVVGDGGMLGHWNGQQWTFEFSPGESIIMDVWGSGPDEVWAVCLNGQILRCVGGRWMVVEGHDWQAPEQVC